MKFSFKQFFPSLSPFPSSSHANCSANSTIDPKEVAFYNKHASEWWDKKGQFAPLLQFNTIRIPFIEKQIRRVNKGASSSVSGGSLLKDVRILDVGCGGGFLCEGLAEQGAEVTGTDIAEESVKVADAHRNSRLPSAQSDVRISLERLKYLCTSVESFRERINFPLPGNDSSPKQSSSSSSITTSSSNPANAACPIPSPSNKDIEQFDVVVTSEVIEHVNNVESFFSHCADFVKPGGILVITTPNRTPLSYIFVILLAEYVFHMLPKGTHFYSKFVKPSEISKMAERHGFSHLETTGTLYVPILNIWFTEPTKWITYMTAFQKQPEGIDETKKKL